MGITAVICTAFGLRWLNWFGMIAPQRGGAKHKLLPKNGNTKLTVMASIHLGQGRMRIAQPLDSHIYRFRYVCFAVSGG